MIKVAMIGAGSVVFSKNLTGDILSYPEFRNATFSYMDIDQDRLEVGAALCRKVAKGMGANPTIEATTDRRKALAGADFVINMVQIGGFDSTLVDFEIPRKYGLNFTIADTTGPGGVFRALRTYPMLKGLAADMAELCPKAWLLNYSNPMCMNMQTLVRTSNVKAVGLCHSVQGTFGELMGYLGYDSHDPSLGFTCGGINHMSFYYKLEKDGKDLYPALFEAMRRPEIFAMNKVRFELMKRLGYFITESSEHNAEYNPWFIPRGKDVIGAFGVPIDEYLMRCDKIVDDFEQMKQVANNDSAMGHSKSHEYGSTIIHSMVTGKPAVVYGNMRNGGAISNLPADAIVETPTLVDKNGCQLTTLGELPVQCVAYMQPHVFQHELFIRAAMEGRRDHVYQAAMYDPLTGATLTTDQIVSMCDELIAAHGFERDGGCLPNLDAKKTLVPMSERNFGKVDPKDLRKNWDRVQAEGSKDFITSWKLIGPFKSQVEGQVSIHQPTDLEAALLKYVSKDPAGPADAPATADLKWSAVKSHNGYVDIARLYPGVEWAVCYALAEIESPAAGPAEIRLGSDDGVKLWLNGTEVMATDVRRSCHKGQDQATVNLKAGRNTLLAKVSQAVGGWALIVEARRL